MPLRILTWRKVPPSLLPCLSNFRPILLMGLGYTSSSDLTGSRMTFEFFYRGSSGKLRQSVLSISRGDGEKVPLCIHQGDASPCPLTAAVNRAFAFLCWRWSSILANARRQTPCRRVKHSLELRRYEFVEASMLRSNCSEFFHCTPLRAL